MQIKDFMGRQTTKIIGHVSDVSGEYRLRIVHSRGIGCAHVQIIDATREDGKWQAITGRFGDDDTLAHLINHMRTYNLVKTAAVRLLPAVEAAIAA